MKTQRTKNGRQRLLVGIATAVLLATLGGNAGAESEMASGILDKNSNKQPRLATAECEAMEFVRAQAESNFAIGLRLFYRPSAQAQQVAVAGDNSLTELTVDENSPFSFKKGLYQLVAVNNNTKTPQRAATITLQLSCDEELPE